MNEVKKPKLDVDDFNGKAFNLFSFKSPSEIADKGHRVSVSQNGYEISLEVLVKTDMYFIGQIITLDASPDRYDDLNVGDKIKFKKENICSIP